jgi:hypothetical protein
MWPWMVGILAAIIAAMLAYDYERPGLDHGQHSAFFKFANNYWCRAGDPCEGKSGRHAVCSPRHTGASDAAHSS